MFKRLTWRAITIFACAVTPGFACGEEAEPPPAPAPPPLVTTHAVTTRDGILGAQIPSDLHVSALTRSLLGTSADGGFRIWIEHRAGATVPAVFGALKDELIGLGWEPGDEQHFQHAIALRMARGPRQHRLQRAIWLIDVTAPRHAASRPLDDDTAPRHAASPPLGDAEDHVLVCDAIASHHQAPRLDRPLRELCQSLRLTLGR